MGRSKSSRGVVSVWTLAAASIFAGTYLVTRCELPSNNTWKNEALLSGVSHMMQTRPNSSALNPVTALNESFWFSTHDARILIYNRVPKTGSSSMNAMIKSLQPDNGFRAVGDKRFKQRHYNRSQQMDVIRNILTEKIKAKNRPIVFNKHVHFIDFQSFRPSRPPPLYFNTVRDPYERFRSRFKWIRSKFQAKFWHKNFANLEPEADPKRLHFGDWMNKTFADCVLSNSDQECNFSNGSIRDFAIPYFCGQDAECTRHNSEWALERAISNVEKHFPIVGVLEQIESTLLTMEAILPTYFANISRKFRGSRVLYRNSQHLAINASSNFERELDERLRQKMRLQLRTEYKFYEFVKQRLDTQVEIIRDMSAREEDAQDIALATLVKKPLQKAE